MEQIILPKKPQIIEQDGNRAVFEIKPCYPGYGVTLGNTLRRVLLSSLPGAAITSVKIKGVSHEFSTIPYVLEDVVQIILNIKEIKLKVHSDEPVSLTLRVKGEKEVKASDIEASSDVEIINKDAHIATLTDKKAEIEMEFKAEKGRGYSTVEQRSKEKKEIGVIDIDAVFSPVRKINYEVEDMRVGEHIDYSRLVIDIETDGSLTPQEALTKSAEIMKDHINALLSSDEEEKNITAEKGKNEDTPVEKKSVPKTAVGDLNLSPRSLKALEENKIKNLSNLVKKSEKDLMDLDGLGEKGVKEIKKVIDKLGFSLKQ